MWLGLKTGTSMPNQRRFCLNDLDLSNRRYSFADSCLSDSEGGELDFSNWHLKRQKQQRG